MSALHGAYSPSDTQAPRQDVWGPLPREARLFLRRWDRTISAGWQLNGGLRTSVPPPLSEAGQNRVCPGSGGEVGRLSLVDEAEATCPRCAGALRQVQMRRRGRDSVNRKQYRGLVAGIDGWSGDCAYLRSSIDWCDTP